MPQARYSIAAATRGRLRSITPSSRAPASRRAETLSARHANRLVLRLRAKKQIVARKTAPASRRICSHHRTACGIKRSLYGTRAQTGEHLSIASAQTRVCAPIRAPARLALRVGSRFDEAHAPGDRTDRLVADRAGARIG